MAGFLSGGIGFGRPAGIPDNGSGGILGGFDLGGGQEGGLLAAAKPNTFDIISMVASGLQDANAGYRGQKGGYLDANLQETHGQRLRAALLQGLSSEDPTVRQRAYQAASMYGIDTKPFQQQQASQALPKLFSAMQPQELVAPSASADISLPSIRPGAPAQTSALNLPQLNTGQMTPGMGFQEALAQNGNPELQAQLAPELFKNLIAGPKYEKLGNDLVELPTLQGGAPRIAMAGPLDAPKTRTVRIGPEDVTQEFDQKSGKWSEVGRGAAFKPDSASENGVVVPPGAGLIDRRTGKPLYMAPPKKLPASVQNAESDDINAIQTARGLSKDLGVIRKQIETGQLVLGPIANNAGRAMNYMGMGNDNSHRFATFKASLEKQRNDSLRLNKGVQTDGDAQRAWKELFDNLNDQNLVKERLAEIQAINDRGANLRAQQIDLRRRNFDYPDFDQSQIDPQAALGGAGSTGNPNGQRPPASPQRRTGKPPTVSNW